MGYFYSPDGNLEVWEEKPADYFSVDEWEQNHQPENPNDDRSNTEIRRDYYTLESDHLRDEAMNYWLEAEAWRSEDNIDRALEAEEKRNQALSQLIRIKERIRGEIPD